MRAHSTPLTVVALVLLTLLAPVTPALAAVVVPIADDDLIAGADVVVLGRVWRITSHEDAAGEIATYVTLAIDEVLKGALGGTEITIREAGGAVGDRQAWVSANPEFTIGESVLVFMDQRPDGTLRTYHFYLGKFSIVTDPASGDRVALRAVPANVTVLSPWPGAALVPPGDVARGLDDFAQLVRERAFDPRLPGARPLLPFASAAIPPDGLVEEHHDFRFLVDPDPPGGVNPDALTPRWAGADANVPVTVRIFSGGEPSASTLGFDQVRAAFRAWSRVPTASFRFAEGPPINGTGGQVLDGINTISFRDPRAQISDPAGCSGILASTSIWASTASQSTASGRTFSQMREFDVVTANGWNGCGFYENFSNFAEVMTHELGHALGLGHSADTSADVVNLGGRVGATMTARAHFDGRVNGLHADDRAGVTYMYPGRTLTILLAGNGSGMIASGIDGINCPPDCAAGFAPNTTVALGITPAVGSTFGGFLEAGCGTSVVMSGDRTCTATFTSGPSGPPTTFVDVPASHPLLAWIEASFRAGVTDACATTPLMFCPDGVVTRAQMAIFLLRGIHGAAYQPPAAVGLFADVSIFDPAAPWIEQLFRESITAGCGANPPQYCPGSGVTRGQMAVFMLRARHGAAYSPPPTTGLFSDVPPSHPFARWIEQLSREGITGGCGPATYCPDWTITRAQMAVFLVRTFNLPM